MDRLEELQVQSGTSLLLREAPASDPFGCVSGAPGGPFAPGTGLALHLTVHDEGAASREANGTLLLKAEAKVFDPAGLWMSSEHATRYVPAPAAGDPMCATLSARVPGFAEPGLYTVQVVGSLGGEAFFTEARALVEEGFEREGEREPNDALDMAHALAAGVAVAGRADNGTADHYALTGAGHEVLVQLNAPEGELHIEALSAEGAPLAHTVARAGAGAVALVLPEGAAYVRVMGHGGAPYLIGPAPGA